MDNGHAHLRNPWVAFHGPNLGYIFEQYEKFLNNEIIDSSLKEKFQSWGAPTYLLEQHQQVTVEKPNTEHILKIVKLLDSIRSQGHLIAKINPLDDEEKKAPFSRLEQFHLTEDDLKAIPAKTVLADCPQGVQTAWDAMERLKETYTQSISFEFDHVEERTWLYQLVEGYPFHDFLAKEEKVQLLQSITEVEGFEQFLHRTFVGQKRFSIEGLDALVPVLNELVDQSASDANHILIGMAHRGRLSVLTHVLKKAYHYIFAEFQHMSMDGDQNHGWAGDAKYHLGWEQTYSKDTKVTLANNPSHLEFVNPVIEGFTRAAQDNRQLEGYPTQDTSKALAILVHGDAAFPGQGIVSETLNLANIPGYSTGGTIHVIANNLIGFTTDSCDSRSTKYASDLAKGFGIPIIHVNGDEPEACLAAARIAYQYRTQFQKDVLIDLVGYRRFGHNEMDDPVVTQPKVYKKISQHPTVRAIYAQQLQMEGTITATEIEQLNQTVQSKLKGEYEKIFQQKDAKEDVPSLPENIKNGIPMIHTRVPFHVLQKINTELLTWKEDFHLYPKLKKILERRKNALHDDGSIEWALAEELAFATILQDGIPIRLTGQDSQRGTFAHRHIVLHDSETNQMVSPLHGISHARASFTVHNSPLSEAAVVGFEYGYNVFAPETLVLWEAQYGDFSNTAQTFFDQFISAGRAKWNQKSGLTLLLPHGYEGQGSEHSSARPERFLQLSAEVNWTVANVTTAAQYFHLLRRQAAILGTEYVRPLVMMTPKSLLRHPLTSSTIKELTEDAFQTVLEQPSLGKKAEEIKRIIFTTGKMAIDLATEIDKKDFDKLHILRIEQLYPFPTERVKEILAKYRNAEEFVWVQEEPKNMGAWQYIAPHLSSLLASNQILEYIGRPEQSSPAVGDSSIHKPQQEQIIKQALTINSLLYS